MNLSGLNLMDSRLLVFTGISGSGKSAAIQYLLERFPEIEGQGYETIVGNKLEWMPRYETKWLIIDEVINLFDAWRIRRLLKQGHRLIVASHLPASMFKVICLCYAGLYLCTDGESRKLAHYLSNKGIVYDACSMNRFISQFGQSYNTLDVVLSYSQSATLSMAMEYFDRQCRLSLSRS
jgi:hypothetical protein